MSKHIVYYSSYATCSRTVLNQVLCYHIIIIRNYKNLFLRKQKIY